MAPRIDSTVTLSDGRRLAYTEWGTAGGQPVMYFHGTPGCRIWCPDETAATEADVRLILPDRPGVGRSDPKPPRALSDWPADVLELADALGVDRFAVVGVSAGGPYAAACAALIPTRLSAAAIVSSRPLSKYAWEERPGAIDELPEERRAEFELTQNDVVAGADLVAAHYGPEYADLEADPAPIHDELSKAEGDRWFFADPSRVEVFDAHIRETFRQGMDAFKWEELTLYLPWGFRLAEISMPVTVWHGSQDPWVTSADIDWQVRTIPNSSLVVWPDGGHLGFVKHFAEILMAVAPTPQ